MGDQSEKVRFYRPERKFSTLPAPWFWTTSLQNHEKVIFLLFKPLQFSSIQSLSHARLFAIPWTAAHQDYLSIQQLLELTQTHVHRVSDTIQLSHPLSLPSPPAFNLSQHQGLFQWQLFTSGDQSIGASASVLPMNIQGWFPLGLTGLISLLSKKLSKVFSSTIVQEHQFFSAQPSLWSNSQIYTWLLEKS